MKSSTYERSNEAAVPDGGGWKRHVYVRDVQGNIRAVVGENNAVAEQTDYYPYGMPMADVNSSSVQPFKFGGKELEREGGADFYDFEARRLDFAIGRFTSPDPLCEQTPEVSPYAYCAADPVNRVDPDGKDDYYVSHHGTIEYRETDSENDTFYMVTYYYDTDGNPQMLFDLDENGQNISISLDHGVVEKVDDVPYDAGKTYTKIEIRGDENAENLFEFLSVYVAERPALVECSLAQTGEAGEKGLNFITTASQPGKEPGMSNLLSTQLLNGYTIRRLVHSHPIGENVNAGDIKFAEDVTNALQERGLKVPSFQMFHAIKKIYKSFDANTKVE